MRPFATIRSIVKVLAFLSMTLLIHYFGRILIADQFVIPSSSMAPTLRPGDRIIVNKLIFGPRIYTSLRFDKTGQELKTFRLPGLRKLKLNDVIVFNYPIHNDSISFLINHVYCKRVVGLPGDSLAIEHGHYKNNNYEGILGLKSEQDILERTSDYVIPEKFFYIMSDTSSGWSIRNMDPIYIPGKGDTLHITAKNAQFYRRIIEYETVCKVTVDSLGVIYVRGELYDRHVFRHNYYFVAGDNVCDSEDSRYWGLVPEEYIIGVAELISYNKSLATGVFSKSRWFKLIR